MDGFLANVIKYLLFATNFAVFVVGCAVLGIGIYALVDGADLVDIVESADADVSLKVFTSAAIILIVVSVFVVILTFFGCCGAIKESKCMLGTYFTLILAMFVVMIVGAVIGYSQSMDEVRGAVEKSMKKFKDDVDADGVSKEEKAITNAWNTLQGDFTCCGTFFNGTSDAGNSWTAIKDAPYPVTVDGKTYKVPASCCNRFKDDSDNAVENCRMDPYTFNSNLPEDEKLSGCFDKFEDLLTDNKDKILIVGVVIVVIMFLNMLFAFAMCTMAN